MWRRDEQGTVVSEFFNRGCGIMKSLAYSTAYEMAADDYSVDYVQCGGSEER